MTGGCYFCVWRRGRVRSEMADCRLGCAITWSSRWTRLVSECCWTPINSCADRLWKKVHASWHSRVCGTLLKVVRQHAVIKYALWTSRLVDSQAIFFFTTIAKKHPISVLKAIAACWLDSGPLYLFRECSRKDLSVEKFVPNICTRCSSMCVCIYITGQSPVETPPSACQRCTGQTVRPVVAINSRQTRGCQVPGDHADLRVMDVVRGDRHNSR